MSPSSCQLSASRTSTSTPVPNQAEHQHISMLQQASAFIINQMSMNQAINNTPIIKTPYAFNPATPDLRNMVFNQNNANITSGTSSGFSSAGPHHSHLPRPHVSEKNVAH